MNGTGRKKEPDNRLRKGENMKTICPICKTENKERDNFCYTCGTKLHQVCSCWMKGGEPYNCGQNECPGYRLSLFERRKHE